MEVYKEERKVKRCISKKKEVKEQSRRKINKDAGEN